MIESIETPDYDLIVKKCALKVIENYKRYANSWSSGLDIDDFWINRLAGQTKQLVKSIKDDEDYEKIQSRIEDTINILCMMYHEVDQSA